MEFVVMTEVYVHGWVYLLCVLSVNLSIGIHHLQVFSKQHLCTCVQKIKCVTTKPGDKEHRT